LQVSERPWEPVLAAGAADAASAIWLDEVLALAAEFIGVIILGVLGGVIYLFNHFVFKSRAPRRDDMHDAGEKGKKNNP